MRDAHDVVGDGPCAVPRDPEGFDFAFRLLPFAFDFILPILSSCPS